MDPRHAEENIRVTTPLPHGTGKSVTVLVLASGPKEKEAQEAGADYVGNKDYLTKIKNGWTDVDKIVATPDMMGELGKLGKILGPKGLMPNPKSGTVTMEVGKAVKDFKAGQVELRVESNGIIHVTCGKTSFGKKLNSVNTELTNYLDLNKDLAIVFPDYYLIDENGKIFAQDRRQQVFYKNHVFDIPPNGATTMIRLKTLKKIGYYYKLK